MICSALYSPSTCLALSIATRAARNAMRCERRVGDAAMLLHQGPNVHLCQAREPALQYPDLPHFITEA